MNPKRFGAMLAVCLLLFGLAANRLWPDRTEQLRRMLIPGDPEVTSQAFDTMLDSLRAGGDAGEAVTAFCREILDNAQAPD